MINLVNQCEGLCKYVHIRKDRGFAAPKGTTFGERSLPPNSKLSPLSTYQVAKPLPAIQGPAAGSFWFGSSGGGTQYMFNNNFNYLIRNGYLVPVY